MVWKWWKWRDDAQVDEITAFVLHCVCGGVCELVGPLEVFLIVVVDGEDEARSVKCVGS